MWQLTRHVHWLDQRTTSRSGSSLDRLVGRSKAEAATTMLKRAGEREARLLKNAIEAERAGDHEATWFAMAARAENNRFIAKLKAAIKAAETPAHNKKVSRRSESERDQHGEQTNGN